MNIKLLRACAGLWLLGLLGMWFARAVLELAPQDALFRCAAALWILGGLGYTGFGVFAVLACAREERHRDPTPADLSALIRRR